MNRGSNYLYQFPYILSYYIKILYENIYIPVYWITQAGITNVGN